MPDIVVDRSLILPAACSSQSRYRALLVLLRYGRVSLFIRDGGQEKQLTEEYAGARFGGPSIDDALAAAEREKAQLEEHLGHAPDEWRMLGSRLLFDSYQRTISDHHSRFDGLDLSPLEVVGLRQKLITTTSGIVPDADLLPIIPYTDRRATDIAIHTGLVGGGDLLVTGDSRLIGTPMTHPDTGATLQCIGFDDVVERISTSSFDLTQVNPRVW